MHMWSRTGRRSARGRRGRCRGGLDSVGGQAGDAGMTTAEYAVGTVAACGFGAVLYKVVTSDVVVSALTGAIRRALDVAF